ncbi:hypothetical protein WICPIJ_009527 [Wickerhamomyces pijperi]|uniref:Aminopeptidase n=1 Tax=Wickerhamomyces pijperi TaxID=599730 RepID=A0A9P8TDC1_WICPI|nr:hypothetical protein WICPIJ_009527 [Wickerhamomyces pijperi]
MSVSTNTHTPVNYDLDLSIDHKKHNFNGTVTIDLVRNAQPFSESSSEAFNLTLNACELVVVNATVNETKAKVTVNRVVESITLALEGSKSLHSEDRLTVKIQYIAKINQIKTFKDFTKGLFKTNYLDDKNNNGSNYILATHSQLAFARCIFPCIDDPAVKTQFKLTVKYFDQDFKITSCSPIEKQTINEEDQSVTVSFQQTPPMATSIFGFALGHFEYLESKVKLMKGEITVRFLTPVGQYQEAAYAFDIACVALPFIEKQFNHAFPLEKLDIVALPFLSDGAMENFGLITIQSSHVLVEKLNHPQQLQSIRQLIVHELIHHWMGNYVSFSQWADLWFNESFATWFAYYVLAQLKLDSLDEAVWEWQLDERENLFAAGVDTHCIVHQQRESLVWKRTQEAFDTKSYSKGLQFLNMFANVIENGKFDFDLSGKFIPLLTKFFEKYAYKAVSVDDFWRFMDSEVSDSGFKLYDFVQSWLRSEGVPLVQVRSEGDSVQISQVKYGSLQQSNFHVPLLMKTTDNQIINTVVSKPQTTVAKSDLLKFNAESIGVYKVQYTDRETVAHIISNYPKLSQFDKISLINDLSVFIGSELYHSDIQVEFLFKISKQIFASDSQDLELLNAVIPTLEKFNSLLKLADRTRHSKFNEFLQSETLKIFHTLQTDQLSTRSPTELELLNIVLAINCNDKHVITYAEDIFKSLHQSKAGVKTPTVILPSVFQIIATTASLNQWKKILELVKTPTDVHHITGETIDVQTAAIKAIGYSTNPQMISRVCNFVLNNFDMKFVELAFIGLTFNFNENKEEMLRFLNVNLSQLVKKCSAATTDDKLKESYSKSLKGLICLVLNGLVYTDAGESDIAKLMDKFKDVKMLKECLADVRSFNKGNLKIVKSLERLTDRVL